MLCASAGERVPSGVEITATLTKPIKQSQLYDAIAAASPGPQARAPGRAADADGSLVLIAEDNDINCVVARALLNKRGLQVDIAHNGREAVEMAAKHNYAVIFMDCHMPEVDGFEATRRIRAAASERRVPIIAMTALSMAGDRERCLAAGMDDYVAKPIRGEQLEEVLERWLAPGPAEGEPAVANQGTQGREEAGEAPVLDEATILQLKETLTAEMRQQLVETFDEQLERCSADIAAAAARGDHGEVRRVAHLLKGSSATFGAHRLRDCCLALEHAGRQSDVPVGEADVERLRETAAEAAGALHERLL
jgi:CheY-like chemotaxis protein/HPt (histidine-containing phosphotransfer) domain-containing protein